VFLIQNTQNRDGAAIQAKLDELIRASASQNDFIGIEHLTQAEVEEFRVKCAERAAAATPGVKARADEKASKAAAGEPAIQGENASPGWR
jgi:low affinity Fe/Cu permease